MRELSAKQFELILENGLASYKYLRGNSTTDKLFNEEEESERALTYRQLYNRLKFLSSEGKSDYKIYFFKNTWFITKSIEDFMSLSLKEFMNLLNNNPDRKIDFSSLNIKELMFLLDKNSDSEIMVTRTEGAALYTGAIQGIVVNDIGKEIIFVPLGIRNKTVYTREALL